MAILYKLRQDNRVNSTKKGKWYARAVMNGTVTLEDVAAIIQTNCTAKYSDVLAVLYEMREVIKNKLQDSYAVKIDGLGIFRIGLKTKAADTAADFTVGGNVVGMRVNFLPTTNIDTATKARTVYLCQGAKVQETAKNTVDTTTTVVTP